VEYVPFGDLSALEKTVTPEVAALLLEPIQAEVGGETPPPGYLQSAREICDRTGALLIVDEVRTAMGRTGPFLAVQKEEVEPDILAIGKSLAGGIVPIGAILARSSLWGRFGLSFSMSASSFAGNRLACVAAIEALGIFDDERILEQGRETGAFLWSGVRNLPALYPDLVERISGRGMLIGIHFKNPKQAGEVIRRAISDGLLVAAAFCNNRCLLIEPPLILDRAQAKRGLKILHDACEVAGKPSPEYGFPPHTARTLRDGQSAES
jgi:putrescine aminotransferase